MEHIEEFQKLNIRVKDIPEEHRFDVFIGSLKDNIQHDVRFWELDSLEKAFRLARKMERKIMATRKHTTHNYKWRTRRPIQMFYFRYISASTLMHPFPNLVSSQMSGR